MGTVPPGTGPLSPEFTGIDPGLMDGFVAQMQHAREMIGEHAESIRRVFAANGIPAASLAPIGEVEQWIDERLPDLRRRTQIARNMAKLPTWTPAAASALVPYDEKKILPPAEARRLGTDLADKYKEIDPDAFFDPGLDEKYQEIVETLAAHTQDPEFTAAFFAGLGLRRTLALPKRLRRGLEEGVQSAIETVSRAFGTAVSGSSPAAGFGAIKKAVKDEAMDADEVEGIGNLISAGRFPTEWLAQLVAMRVFTPGNTLRGASLTPYLNALAHDSAAARLAVSLVTRGSPLVRNRLADAFHLSLALPYDKVDRRPDLVLFLKNLSSRASVDDSSADAFGKLLASASGAYDERDGEHGDAAARFAFTVITAVDEFTIAEPTRVHLSEIAGAYAMEMTEGANLADANHLLPSAFEVVNSRILGLKSVFRLSPADTYRFIKAFADSPANRRPFQDGMGTLARRLINEGVPAMIKSQDSTRLDDVFAALGNVRGLELGAAKALGKVIDEAAEDARSAWSFGFGTVLGVAGLAIPGTGGAIFWTALSSTWSFYDTYKDEPEAEEDKEDRANTLETLGRQHTITQAMMDAGFTPKVPLREYLATCPPGVAIADGNGRLRPFPDILQSGESGMAALDQWFTLNGLGSDKNSIGDLSRFFADSFDGRKDVASRRAPLYPD
ncbi:DUF6571 family protein [Planotetraspora sp. GP83]|uniref:DUF6571 family protein n=1 Tax=Planotetraspora sp. GP83 TaxID=3156264 RepID=UPI0035180C38